MPKVVKGQLMSSPKDMLSQQETLGAHLHGWGQTEVPGGSDAKIMYALTVYIIHMCWACNCFLAKNQKPPALLFLLYFGKCDCIYTHFFSSFAKILGSMFLFCFKPQSSSLIEVIKTQVFSVLNMPLWWKGDSHIFHTRV